LSEVDIEALAAVMVDHLPLALIITSLATGFVLSSLFKVRYARPRKDLFTPLIV